MKNNKNYLYIIKNVISHELLLVYNISENKFILLDKNKMIVNDSYISNFELHYVNDISYNLVYKYNDKKYVKPIKLVFSSTNLDNPLLFNIYIKNGDNYEILRSNCENILCNTHYVKTQITDIKRFNKKPSYVFYLNYKNLMPCRIRVNKDLFNVLGYTKSPNLNNLNNLNNSNSDKNPYNITCNVNRDLQNSYKVNYKKKCKYINFKDNIYNDKLNQCSITHNNNTLLSKVPKIVEIFTQLIKKKNKIQAGKSKCKLDKVKNKLEDKLGDEETSDYFEKINNTLGPTYQSVLTSVLEDFNSQDDNTKTNENYKKILNKIYEHSKEYKLLGNYKMCNGVKLTNICNVENVVDCQDKCNQIHDCAHLSYDIRKKTCKLYNTCKTMKDNYYYTSYSKQSILRTHGYSLYNSILLYFNTPIPEIPLLVRGIMFICGTMIVIISSILIFRFMKISIKFILCFYYDTCYSPTELLNTFLFKDTEIKERYI